jgi:hypothetical protein
VGRASELLGVFGRESAPDEEVIPARAVLIEQQHWLSRRAGPCRRARRLNFHQRYQTVDLRLVR